MQKQVYEVYAHRKEILKELETFKKDKLCSI